MSIADKVLQLKQDFDNVYEAGKSSGGSGDYEQGFEDGKSLLKNVKTFVSLDFGKTAILDLTHLTTFEKCFEEATGDTEHLTIIANDNITNFHQMFDCDKNCYGLKRVTLNFDTQNGTDFSYMFYKRHALEIIDGTPLNLTKCITHLNTIAKNCESLKEIRFVENTIKVSIGFPNSENLSTETIQSIIDGLADLTGGTAQTLTLHADVGAKLTDEQKATVTAKNWTLVY